MTGLIANGFTKHPRFCLDCGHVHGVFAYGLCMEQLGGGICPCVELRTTRHRRRRLKAAHQVTTRTLTRWSAQMFAELSPAERATYERWVRRWLDSDLQLREFATEVGIDEKLLWRTWKVLESEARRE